MTSSLQSGNEVIILFNGSFDQSAGQVDVKDIISELRRDLAQLKRPLRVLRHIPGCYVEFASGALRGSVVLMKDKAPSRLFDVQMIVGRGHMTQAKRSLVHEHQTHLSVSVTVDCDDEDTRPPMTALDALKRISKSAIAHLHHEEPTVVYWGPSVETFDRAEALAYFDNRSIVSATVHCQPVSAAELRPVVPHAHAAHAMSDIEREAAVASHMRGKVKARQRASAAANRVATGAAAVANSGYGKVAAGLALGMLLHAGLSDTVQVERAFAETLRADYITDVTD